MKVEFRKAIIPDEIEALCAFDRIAFESFPADLFGPEDWARYESYWMIGDGKTVGCSAFVHDVDYDEQPRTKCLWIVSTGIHPEFQGQGLGLRQKQWQIDYARQRGFEMIVTNMRQSNGRIIRLNEKLGFTTRELVPGYYADPEEAAVVMELNLRLRTKTDEPESERIPRARSGIVQAKDIGSKGLDAEIAALGNTFVRKTCALPE